MVDQKPEKENIILSLVDDLDFGVEYTQALTMFVEKTGKSTRTFDRYWREAKERFYEGLNDKVAAKAHVVNSPEIQAYKARIIDKFERMQILSAMADGSLQVPRNVVTREGVITLEAFPDYTDRKAAIAELNKMDGEYAPIKKETKHSGDMVIKQDLSNLSTEELLKRASAVKKLNG